MNRKPFFPLLLTTFTLPAHADDVDALIAAMLGDTPVIADLQNLTDTVGGRVTGTPANEAAVEWALARFHDAGVSARAEPFEMPRQWQERAVSARIRGDIDFEPGVVAKPYRGCAQPDRFAGRCELRIELPRGIRHFRQAGSAAAKVERRGCRSDHLGFRQRERSSAATVP